MSQTKAVLDLLGRDESLLNSSANDIMDAVGEQMSHSVVSKAKAKYVQGLPRERAKQIRGSLKSNTLKKAAKRASGKKGVSAKSTGEKVKKGKSPESFEDRMGGLMRISLDSGKVSKERQSESPVPISSSSKAFAAYEVVFVTTDFTDDGSFLLRSFVSSVNDKLGTEDLSVIEIANPRSLEVRKNLGGK